MTHPQRPSQIRGTQPHGAQPRAAQPQAPDDELSGVLLVLAFMAALAVVALLVL